MNNYQELIDDRNREYIDDMTCSGVSNCCGASVISGICMECREHCEEVSEE